MARTSMEKRKLKVVYDARRDGWRPEAYHGKVDGTGPAVVYAKTRGGAIIGGYNPKGWAGYGEYRNSIAAFLFHFPPGVKDATQAYKLPKACDTGAHATRARWLCPKLPINPSNAHSPSLHATGGLCWALRDRCAGDGPALRSGWALRGNVECESETRHQPSWQRLRAATRRRLERLRRGGRRRRARGA
mmetsp:Transcript_45187/g.141592  ORF Transcript_45187/g.141592 Transcript_45187/m.141592 type:complete len:189 (-) Transcript_45187:298-864(-)